MRSISPGELLRVIVTAVAANLEIESDRVCGSGVPLSPGRHGSRSRGSCSSGLVCVANKAKTRVGLVAECGQDMGAGSRGPG